MTRCRPVVFAMLIALVSAAAPRLGLPAAAQPVAAGRSHGGAPVQPLATYGPFRVLDPARAALMDATDSASPAQFLAMLRAFPQIAVLELIECPGTEDDRANLRLGRMIRARGITTVVPAGASVRPGGVELFLAGAHRFADPSAECAVHAWADENGREAPDYPPDAPENRAYI